jgi:7-cyano-7-deazaguanine synthase
MFVLDTDRALVLFSGGQDSTTCLYWAKARYREVVALSLDYGQRHHAELTQAARIAQIAGVQHFTLPIHALEVIGNTALTDQNIAVRNSLNPENQLPNTFVPGRNLLFLTLAAALAYRERIGELVGGMCQTDYSGYPDCRLPFVEATQQTLRLATDADFRIHTPLMFLTKAETWLLARELNCLEVVVHESHTCYNNDRTHLHPWGYGCGHCPACELRAKGYNEAFGK